MRQVRAKTFLAFLPMGLMMLLQTLVATPVSAQCPALSAEGTTPGITKFNTVKSQMWHNDGLWWGAFSDSSNGIFSSTVFRMLRLRRDPSSTPTQKDCPMFFGTAATSS